MTVLVGLAIILFVLMRIIGGEKGTKSFIALFLNFVIVFMMMLLTVYEKDPIFLTFIACILVSCVNLFYINEVNLKTKTAFVATLMTVFILFILVYGLMEFAKIQGFGEEEVEELSTFSFYIGIDFIKVGISTILLGMIGAVTDTAISIASAMNEIYFHNPLLTKKNLFKSGMTVGKDILGTTTNTLFFAFVGGYLALILWFKDIYYSFETIINSKVFMAEVLSILCIGIGAILIIPITAWLTAMVLTKVEKT